MLKHKMGGGKSEWCNNSSEASSSSIVDGSSNIICCLCEIEMHDPISCPWLYSRCKNVPCNGVRKLLKSETEDLPAEKFLRCSVCSYFEWFADAKNPKTSMKVQLPTPHSCFACGDKSHVHNKCPWKNQACKKKNCKGTVKLLFCHNVHNFNIAYLKCSHCNDFQWLSDAVFHAAKSYAKQTSLKMAELCKEIVDLQM